MGPLVIPTIYTAINRMASVQAQIAAGNKYIGVSATIAGARMERSLNAISEKAMAVGRTAGTIGIGIVAPLGLATYAAVQFEKQMSNVATIVDTSKESITAMGDEVLKISQKVPVKIHDLTESLYQIRSEGFGGAYAMDILGTSAKLSVAGLSSATDATKSMASAIRVFGDEGLTTTQIADIFFKTVATGRTKMEAINESFGSNAAIVHEAGVRFAEFQAATAAMTNSGMTASEAQTALKGATIALIKPSTEMEKVLRRLGVTTGQQLIQKMGGLVPAMKAVGETAKSTGINVNDAFGRVQGLTAYTLLTGSLSSQFEQDFARMTNGVNELGDAFAKQAGTTASKWQQLQNNVQILGIRVGTLLLPAVISLSNAIISIVKPIADWANRHKTLSGIIIKSAAFIGVLALATSAFSFAVGIVTKSLWLWRAAIVAYNVVSTIFLAVTGSSTAGIYANAWATNAATLATGGFNTAIMTTLGTVSKLGVTLLWMYGIWKLFDKKQEAINKMDVITQHLPEGVDKQKFTDQFQDIISPGHISLLNKMKGVKSYYPQEMYDSLATKYATPEAMQAAEENNTYSNTTTTKESKDVNHHFTIDLRQDGKTVQTINSANLMPSLSSTSSYNSND